MSLAMGYTCLVSRRSRLDFCFHYVVASSSMVSGAGAFISAVGSVASGLTSTAGPLVSAFGHDRKWQTAIASMPPAAPAGIGSILEFDSAAMVFEHAADDRKAKPVPLARVVT